MREPTLPSSLTARRADVATALRVSGERLHLTELVEMQSVGSDDRAI